VGQSNPFVSRWIPTPDESMIVIRFANPRGIDFPYLLSMLDSSHMSRANSIVVPGGKLDIAMQLILTPSFCSSWRRSAAPSKATRVACLDAEARRGRKVSSCWSDSMGDRAHGIDALSRDRNL